MRVGALLLALLPAHALAAEVVWLQAAPSREVEQAVAVQAGAASDPLTPAAFRAAATRWDADDEQALANLERVLDEVRDHEHRLDGELAIMRELQAAIERIEVVRHQADRYLLYRALAYQGFAVDRYWGKKFATDPDAAPWRLSVGGDLYEQPWLDATALEPDREITADEIGESPQRMQYSIAREDLHGLTRAVLTADALPAGADVIIDGRLADEPDEFQVAPGLHYVHVELEGHIVARHRIRVDAGQGASITVPVSDAHWMRFEEQAIAGWGEVPEGLAPSIDALGGEVWVAKPVAFSKAVELTRATRDTLERIEQKAPEPEPEHRTVKERGGRFSGAAHAGMGWLGSPDFYAQDPVGAPHTGATVNAPAPAVALDLAYDQGLFRVGAGLDVLIPTGTWHVARSGDASWRARLFPHAFVGARYAQVSVGYLFPYHPAAGVRATIPLPKGLELRGSALVGFGGTRARSDGTEFDLSSLASAWVGIGYRLSSP